MKTPQESKASIEETTITRSFLNFPREIRDEIYSLLFISDDRVVYPSKSRAKSISEAINFLRANKQIYSEAVTVLYSQNMFQIRGDPAFKAPELLNLLVFQRRKDLLRQPPSASLVCRARLHLKKLSIPSHGISLDRLKHIFSLVQHFPMLEHIQVIYLGTRDTNDMEIVNICRLLQDRRPLLQSFFLGKRVSYFKAEDISWMVLERPYKKWVAVYPGEGGSESTRSRQSKMWLSGLGDRREAVLVDAPQALPE